MTNSQKKSLQRVLFISIALNASCHIVSAHAEPSFGASLGYETFGDAFSPTLYPEVSVGYEFSPSLSLMAKYGFARTQINSSANNPYGDANAFTGIPVSPDNISSDLHTYSVSAQYGKTYCGSTCITPFMTIGIGGLHIDGAKPNSIADQQNISNDYLRYIAGAGITWELDKQTDAYIQANYIRWDMPSRIDSPAGSINRDYTVNSTYIGLGLVYKPWAKQDSITTLSADYPHYESPEHPYDVEPNQILVLSQTPDISLPRSTNQADSTIVASETTTLKNLGYTLTTLTVNDDSSTNSVAKLVAQENPNAIVDVNSKYYLQASSTTKSKSAPILYATELLTQNTTQKQTNHKSHTRIGVIDTGISAASLKENGLSARFSYKNVLKKTDKIAPMQHGSAIAQLIAGKHHASGFSGLAKPAQIDWVNAMKSSNNQIHTNSVYLSKSLDHLVGKKVHLINMSLGGRGDRILQRIISDVLKRHISIVAAVGNNPKSNAKPMYPANYSGVIGISAVDANLKRYRKAQQANYTDISAPGVEVWAPSENGGRYMSGTSFATALASAVLINQPSSFWKLNAKNKLNKLCKNTIKPRSPKFMGCGVIQSP